MLSLQWCFLTSEIKPKHLWHFRILLIIGNQDLDNISLLKDTFSHAKQPFLFLPALSVAQEIVCLVNYCLGLSRWGTNNLSSRVAEVMGIVFFCKFPVMKYAT